MPCLSCDLWHVLYAVPNPRCRVRDRIPAFAGRETRVRAPSIQCVHPMCWLPFCSLGE